MSLLVPHTEELSPQKKKTRGGGNSGSSDSKWLLEGVKSHSVGVGVGLSSMASYGTLRTITPQPEEEKTPPPPPPLASSGSSLSSSSFFSSQPRNILSCSSSSSSFVTTSTSCSSLAPNSPYAEFSTPSTTSNESSPIDETVIDILPRLRSQSADPTTTTAATERSSVAQAAASHSYVFYSSMSDSPNVLSPRCGSPASRGLPGVPRKIMKSQSVMNLHSILRTPSVRCGFQRERLRKSTSVGFALDLAEDSASSPTAKKKDVPRLTDEEKEELYRSRPDLNISPVPSFVLEHLEMLKKQKHRKIVVSIIAGILTLLMLMIVYQLVTLDET